ncbi:uncharacterized protein LOC110824099 isoform X3 [Carica papaya]|nr:uncharacterized protein LOC110824099 isoform X3 [Carica papaya]
MPPGNIAPTAGYNSVPSTNKSVHRIQAGTSASGNIYIRTQPPTSILPNNQKNIKKIRVPFKCANPRWYRTPASDKNLVISFSDDDSDSESDSQEQGKALKVQSGTSGPGGNQRPPSSSLAKSKRSRQSAGNVNGLMRKNFYVRRIFNAGTNARSPGPSLVEQHSQLKKFNRVNKNVGNRDRQCDRTLGFSDSKLQELKQQIAIRESKLKRKLCQQSKESNLVSCKEYNSPNTSNDASRKCNSASGDTEILGPKEPDKKRIKVGESYPAQVVSDSGGKVSPAQSALPPKNLLLEEGSLHDDNKVDSRHEGISMSRKDSDVKTNKLDGRRVDVPPEKIHGVNISGSSNQTDEVRSPIDHFVMSHQIAPKANIISDTLPENTSSAEQNQPSNFGGDIPGNSSLNRATTKQNLVKSNTDCKMLFGNKALKASLNNKSRVSVNNRHEGSLGNASIWSGSDNINVFGHGSQNIESLADMEESLDKELEEGQEYRRICEIEERNALKAYRRAQRSLIEANARCVDLYRRREMCSAHFRSFLMHDSSLLLSSRQHANAGIAFDDIDNRTENMDIIPKSYGIQLDYDEFNQPVYNSNLHCANSGPRNLPYHHGSGQNLGSEPCSEPDASTSEQLPCNGKHAGNMISSPSSDPNISLDEDEETLSMDNESAQFNSGCQPKERTLEITKDSTNNELKDMFLIDSCQDSFLLEAALRSELFARLGRRTMSKNGTSCYNMECVVEQGAESDGGSEKTLMSEGSIPLLETEKNQQYKFRGTDRLERSVSQENVQKEEQWHVEKSSLKVYSSSDLEGSGTRNHVPFFSALPSSLILRSAFRHLKMMSPNTPMLTENGCKKHESDNTCEDEMQQKDLTASLLLDRESSSYSCDSKIDPLWPLCMYELRGKCNNDECPWQHLNNCSGGNRHRCHISDNADCQVGLTSKQQKSNDVIKLSKYHNVLTPPTYFVSLDVMKVNSHSYESLGAKKNGQCWWKVFSISLALSSFLQNNFFADRSCLRGCDGRIEVYGSWNRQASYFQSKNGIMNQLKEGFGAAVQSLEVALLILNQEVNKVDGVKKALNVLSRSLEANPASEILWMVYLFIFYSNARTLGKDDMLYHAVKHNEKSYGLWLMYINSRIQLDDHLIAFDAALSVLCRHGSASEGDGMYASACILDLFMQMMNCLCMSGNVEKAIQRIFEQLPAAAAASDESDPLMLSHIAACLSIADKCVFWICCVYLVIYRKLPGAVVQQFEFEKELSSVSWPSIQLADKEKQGAVELLEMGASSIELFVNNGSFESKVNLRSAELFALNHLRCMLALGDLECYGNLLNKYVKLYPSCLELALLSARVQQNDNEDLTFARFEETLNNWPEEAPGIQCIWNQYAEFALQNGKSGFVKELMVRWFSSVWEVQYPQMENLNFLDGSQSGGTVTATNSNKMDVLFGFLNLSLHKLLQNDHAGARLAIDQALRIVVPENLIHFLREHAVLLLIDESQSKDNFSINCQFNILKKILDHAQSFPLLEPLPMQPIKNIEKPRIQQLVYNLLIPVSFDFTVVNCILETWYGPYLLPPALTKLKDLVDFVEAILELAPSNYPLAISTCKLLTGRCSHANDEYASILFWASSALSNALFHAIPVAPEYIWVEAADILGNIAGVEPISEGFYKKVLSVYPFSVKLWQCYYNHSKNTGSMSNVMEAARERGIKID